MGSWLGTCMLSDLPIEEGEEVVIIPYIQNDRRVEAALVPLFGRYEDCGCAVFEDSDRTKAVFDVLSKYTEVNFKLDKGLVAEARASFKAYEDATEEEKSSRYERVREFEKELKRTTIGKICVSNEQPKTLQDLLNDNNGAKIALLSSWHGKLNLAPISYVMIHKAVWDKVASSILTESKFLLMGKSTDTEDRWSYVSGEEYFDKSVIEVFKHSAFLAEEGLKGCPESAMPAMRRMEKIQVEQFAYRFYGAVEESGGYNKTHMLDLVAPNGRMSDLYAEERIGMLKDVWVLGQALCMMRKDMHIPAGTGSQTTSYTTMKALANAMMSVCDDKIKQSEGN